jgi:hypothetical protein
MKKIIYLLLYVLCAFWYCWIWDLVYGLCVSSQFTSQCCLLLICLAAARFSSAAVAVLFCVVRELLSFLFSCFRLSWCRRSDPPLLPVPSFCFSFQVLVSLLWQLRCELFFLCGQISSFTGFSLRVACSRAQERSSGVLARERRATQLPSP